MTKGTKTIKPLKSEIKYSIQLNEEQKIGKQAIMSGEIIIVTGSAGTGKTLMVSQTILDMHFKRMCHELLLTKAMVETGNKTMGYLPGDINSKVSPYIESFVDSLKKVYSEHKEKIDKMLDEGVLKGYPINFIRGKNIDLGQILICDEAQNTTKNEMLAILTRLSKGGKIIILGDPMQCDTKDPNNGLVYVMEMAKQLTEIKHIKLKENHRSDLVGKILDYEYAKIKKNEL